MDSSESTRSNSSVTTLGQALKSQAIILGGIVILMWFLEVVDWIVLKGSLDTLGVQPRTLSGLKGIIFMPFLHSGFGHLIANTLPFLILGWLVMVRRMTDFFVVAAVVVVVSGLGIWLFGGANTIHIGASGLVFGFFGFILLTAYFERSVKAILLALVTLFFYGGLILGVLPFQAGISWQGHLFGFIGGALAAYLLARSRETQMD